MISVGKISLINNLKAMKIIIPVVILLSAIAILIGFRYYQNAVGLKEYSATLAISRAELAGGYNIKVGEPEITIDSPKVFFFNGYRGAVIVTYSAAGGPFAYTVLVYASEQSARQAFNSNKLQYKDMIAVEPSLSIIEESDSPVAHVLVRIANEAGGYNYTYHFQQGNFVAVIMSVSENIFDNQENNPSLLLSSKLNNIINR